MTSSWFGRHDLPPDDVEDLAPYVDDVVRQVRQFGDGDVFGAGLWLLLADREHDLASLSSGHYRYDDAEMRDVVAYVLRRLYPDFTHDDVPPEARLDWTEWAGEWWVRRGVLHQSRPGETLRGIADARRIPLDPVLRANWVERDEFGPDKSLPVGRTIWLREPRA